MKKTIIFDFPEDFKFPRYFDEYSCKGCPFVTNSSVEDWMCFLTLDGDPVQDKKVECPFYSGKNTVNWDEI